MRNETSWQATKFVQRSGAWRASNDPAALSVGSRLISGLLIGHYNTAIDAFARGHLLDLGCGKAPLYGIYRKVVLETTCTDWPNSVHGSPYIDVAADLSQSLPFASDAFDTVLATDVLEHIPQPERLMGEIGRVLRGGGHLILGVPFFYWLHEAPYDFYRYTEFALRRFCVTAGLNVVRLEPYGGALDIILDIMCKHAARWPRVGRAFSCLAVALSRSGLGRRTSAWQLDNFPLGYCLVAQKPSVAAPASDRYSSSPSAFAEANLDPALAVE